MLAPEVARKYAHALFLSAKGKGLIDKAYEQLSDLKNYLEPDLLYNLHFLKLFFQQIQTAADGAVDYFVV